jgi:hypothetical protein
MILPVVLYVYKTWALEFREEHELSVFENGVLRKIFRLKTDGIIGGWRILHIENRHNQHSSPNIIITIKSKMMRLTEHVARMGESFGGKARRKETTRKT